MFIKESNIDPASESDTPREEVTFSILGGSSIAKSYIIACQVAAAV